MTKLLKQKGQKQKEGDSKKVLEFFYLSSKEDASSYLLRGTGSFILFGIGTEILHFYQLETQKNEFKVGESHLQNLKFM